MYVQSNGVSDYDFTYKIERESIHKHCFSMCERKKKINEEGNTTWLALKSQHCFLFLRKDFLSHYTFRFPPKMYKISFSITCCFPFHWLHELYNFCFHSVKLGLSSNVLLERWNQMTSFRQRVREGKKEWEWETESVCM